MKLALKDMLSTNELKKSFLHLISYYYPLTEKELTAYGNLLSWRGISENRNITWTESLFFEHLDKISAFHFYHYAELPWSIEMIDKLIASQYASWNDLTSNKSLLEHVTLFAHALPHWNEEMNWKFPEHRFTRKVVFGQNKTHEYEQIIQDQKRFNWKQWSAIDTFFWREEFIAANEEKWDWNLLSNNHSLPWSEPFITRFKDKWNWSILSANLSLPWSTALIEKFKEDLDWSSLCVFIPMSYDLVKHFDQYWDWSHLNGMLSYNAEKYGDYTISFYQTYQFPTFQEGDLNRIMEQYSKEIIWFEYIEDDHMRAPFFEGGIILPIKWDIAFFNTVKDDIDLQYEEVLVNNESENLQSRYKGKHWTRHLKNTYLDKDLLEYFKALENQKGISCINWKSIAITSQLVADDEFLSRYFKELSTLLLIRNESFDWDKHFQKIRNTLTKGDWELIGKNKKMDMEIVKKYREQLTLSSINQNPHLSMSIIDYFEKEWSDTDWYWLSTLSIVTPKSVTKKYPWRWDGLLQYGIGLTEHLDRDLLHLFLERVSDEKND